MADLPPLPPGFTLDQAPTGGALPPLPPGFKLDQAPSNAPKGDPNDTSTGVGREVALGSRSVAEGIAGALATPHDLGIMLQNLIAHGVNRLAGTNIPDKKTFAQELSDVLNESGAPQPQTTAERYGSAALRGASGAVAGGGVLNAAGAALSPVRAAIAGVTGATSQEAARQAGAGPVGQFAAGLAGGFAPAALESTATGAGRIATSVVRPLTNAGQQDMAAQVLQSNASDPTAAAANLNQAAPIVAGSARTTGEASQDVGLLALEKGVRGRNTAAFGERLSEQNAARQAALANAAGTPADIAVAQQARTAATTPMRDQALNSGGTADVAPVHQTIDAILESPAGKRESVNSAVSWAKQQIGDNTDPASLYEIRKDLQLAQRGKLQPSSQNAPNASTLAQARGQLGQVVDSLDDAIEAAAPGYKAYLQRYSDMSKPIDQMKVIQEIQRRSQLTQADVTTGQNFLGAGKFSQALDAAIQKNGNTLTPEQTQQLNAIRTDLQYGQAINSPLVKAPGSDTFQNLSIAQVIGAGSNPATAAMKALGKPLQWLYKAAGSDSKVNEILANAMLDPKVASTLLTRATPSTMAQFAAQLRRNVASASIGTAPAVVENPAQ